MSSSRSVAVALVALFAAPALAGCLEAGERDGPGLTPTPPTEPDPSVPTPPQPQEPVNETVRTLVRGQQSDYTQYQELVITTPADWEEFRAGLREDCPYTDGCPEPQVDFGSERVVAVTLGQRGNGCFSVEIVRAETHAANGTTVVEVKEHVPSEDVACAAVVVTPFHAVAIPARDTDVEFVRTTEPVGGGGSGDLSAGAGAGTLRTRDLERGEQSGVDERLFVVVDSEAEWESLWSRHTSRYVSGAPDRPHVDFEKERVLAVFMGERPSGGYGIEVEEAVVAEGSVRVTVRETEPSPDGGVTTVMTYPYHLVAIPAGEEPVEFVD